MSSYSQILVNKKHFQFHLQVYLEQYSNGKKNPVHKNKGVLSWSNFLTDASQDTLYKILRNLHE